MKPTKLNKSYIGLKAELLKKLVEAKKVFSLNRSGANYDTVIKIRTMLETLNNFKSYIEELNN